ncbi:esterase-like activity of phytase family protein [Rhodobacter sp. Har01]|uniref:esterase-like activity of phytase family protein n=1 Tax=Rhodobacter sp. Har01 TaxID=2883999 RepID=UPI001D06FD5A|nr:esterase-like activity of phytase family protein [Rhodobacter sp. Har01]MCB6177730.1 esterase-like activity of phytase family protein [Rhodobacter sp. Har01]
MQNRARLGLTAALLLAASLQGAANPATPAGFVGKFVWSMDAPGFGGFSGLELSADGAAFVALTDRGRWTRGTIRRNAAGAIVGIDAIAPVLLKGRGEAPLKPFRTDSEGLAIAEDGTLFVSFEGWARVLRYAAFGGSAEILPSPEAFRDLALNASLEALAVDDAGRLYTLPEDTAGGTEDFPVFRHDPATGWSQPFTVPREGGFLPVGADFGPDGRLYILERQFLGLGGFASRVRALDPATIPKAGEATGRAAAATVLQTAPGLHGNLEGLSVWQDAAGDLRLSLISDDNFGFFLTTEIVEYRLPR